MKRITAITILLLAIFSCKNNHPAVSATKGGYNIVASFYPVELLLINLVNGSNIKIETLIKDTASHMHDVQLSTKELVSLENASLLVDNGSMNASLLSKIKAIYPDLTIINISDGLDFLPLKNSLDASNDHRHDEAINNHRWLSVSLYIKQLDNLYNHLTILNSENSEVYTKNYLAYKASLETIYSKMKSELASYSGRNVVVFHESFDYFALDFGLNVVATISSEARENINANHIKKLVDLLREDKSIVLFGEDGFSTKLIETVSSESGHSYYMLKSLVAKDGLNSYETMMLANLDVLKKAFN